MHIACSPVQQCRHLQARHQQGRFQIAWRVRLDLRVTGLAQEDRQPADFQVSAGADQKIGRTHLGDQAGAGLDAVRILQSRRSRVDLDLIPA